MVQLNIETGVKTIDIYRNGEKAGVVKFSLSDPALLKRLRDVSAKSDEIQKNSKLDALTDLDEQLNEAVRIDKEMRDLLDWAFAAPVSDVVFGDSFCFTTCDGVTAMEQFLSGVTPLIEEAFQTEVKAADERRKKYLDKYKRK